MTVLREDEFEAFLKRRLASINGILIHGADRSAISALGQQVLRTMAGTADTSAVLQRIDLASLKENPSRLVDEFHALSLLGDRQVLWLEGIDDSHLKALTVILAETGVANFVIGLSDALGKNSKLRVACESADKFASLVIYDEDGAQLATRIRRLLAVDGLSFEKPAEELFFALVGGDRSTAVQEASKLGLYCYGEALITEADVEAVCGNIAGFGTDQLIDAVLAGDLEGSDRMTANLDSDSAGTRGILSVLLVHLTRLQSLRMDMERGLTSDMAVRNSKPAIFFKRRSAILAQLRGLEIQDLIYMQDAVGSAMLQTRKMPNLFEAIVSRALLALARMARAKLN